MEFSPGVEETIANIVRTCQESRQPVMTPEHLLLGLADRDDMKSTWEGLDADVSRLRKGLAASISKNVPALSREEFTETKPALAFQRVLQRAIYQVQGAGKSKVTTGDILLAIFGEKDSRAVSLLTAQGIGRIDVHKLVYRGEKRTPKSDKEKIQERVSEIVIQEIEPTDLPIANDKRRIFVSYCHTDDDCLKRLMVHLAPMVRENAISLWSDRKIRAGDKWKDEISKNLDEANIAILLISADFLASEFVVSNELPPLLLKAERKGLRILPVILKPCGFVRDRTLSSFQCINDPRSPLLGLSHVEQEALYDKVASEVHQEIIANRI